MAEAEEKAIEEMPDEETTPKDPIVAPKVGDTLFYYLKYEGDESVDKIKLKLEVLEYPSGDSFRDVKAKVLEVIESTDDEIKKDDEDIFDLADLDSKDMPIDEFIPRTVDKLLEFSKNQESVEREENQEKETGESEQPENTNEPQESEESEQPNESEKNIKKNTKPPAKGGSRRRKTPRKAKQSKRKTRAKARSRKSK